MVSYGTKTDKLEFSKFEIKDKNGKAGMIISPVDKNSFQSASIILFLYLIFE